MLSSDLDNLIRRVRIRFVYLFKSYCLFKLCLDLDSKRVQVNDGLDLVQ